MVFPTDGSPLEEYRAALKRQSQRNSVILSVAFVLSALVPIARGLAMPAGIFWMLYRQNRTTRELNNVSVPSQHTGQ